MTEPRFDVVCVGNLVADLIVRNLEALPPRTTLQMVEAIDLKAGGCAYTTAYVLSALGARSAMLGAIGDDIFGRFLEEELVKVGVDCSGLLRHSTLGSTATMVVVDGAGERTYVHAAGAAVALRRESLPEELLFSGRAIHVAGALINHDLDGEPTAAIMREAQARGILTSLDTSWDSSGRWERVHAALPYLDVFAPGHPEARMVSGLDDPRKIAAWARGRGAKIAVIKLGPDGAWVDGPGFRGLVPAIPVTAIDTTGAGESFNAGFLYGLLRGWPLERAARLGVATGGRAVSGVGAVAGACSLAEALAFAGLGG
ncbi:MAG: carbohydrate kinase family protein [Thermomicrobiales bacterium]